jgi:hypothetical protein
MVRRLTRNQRGAPHAPPSRRGRSSSLPTARRGKRQSERARTVDVDDGLAFAEADKYVVDVVATLEDLTAVNRAPGEIGIVTFADLERLRPVFAVVDANAARKHIHDAVEFLVVVPLARCIERRHMALADPERAGFQCLFAVLPGVIGPSIS